MANVLVHRKVSAAPEGPSSVPVRTSDWNEGHVFSGGNKGSLLIRETADATYGANWVQSAAGVLTCPGAGQLPAWSLTPAGLTSVTVSGFNAVGGNTQTGTISMIADAGSAFSRFVISADATGSPNVQLLARAVGAHVGFNIGNTPASAVVVMIDGSLDGFLGIGGSGYQSGGDLNQFGTLKHTAAGLLISSLKNTIKIVAGNTLFLGNSSYWQEGTNPTFNVETTGAGYTFLRFANAGNTGGFGVENNVGGGVFTGSSASAVFLGSIGAFPIELFTTNIKRLIVSSGGLLQFAGATAAFPALKRNTTFLESKLADDSAYTQHTMKQLGIIDGVAAPGAAAGFATMYIDQADGDLKIIFGDGVIKTIVVDT